MRTSWILTAGLAMALGVTATSSLAQAQHHRVAGEQISVSSVESVRIGEHVRIENFSTPAGALDLELDRVELLTNDAQLVLGTSEGMSELDETGLVVLRGIVAGDADSIAYIAMSPHGTNGFVRKDGELISISTGPYAQGKELAQALRTVRMEDVIDADRADVPPSACGVEDGDVRFEPVGRPVVDPAPSSSNARGAGVSTCRVASVAVETDWEFNERLFEGNSTAAAAYIMSLMGALSEIYERDFNTRLAISYLRVWGDNSDPYAPNAGDPLDLVRDHWNSNMGHVDRTITHYFTGRRNMPYGGVAYVGVLCFNQYGYGVSGYLDGSFPYPLVDFSYGNWDVLVSAHEIGHNFGTGHTHSIDWYNPTIDDCGNGDCSAPFGGTIMSYCHGCPGGLSNIQIRFHPLVIDYVTGYLDQVDCDLVSVGVTAANDLTQTLEDTPLSIDAMGNDAAQSCDPFVFASLDTVTAQGGSVQRLAGQGPNGRDLFRYAPPAGFVGMDSFAYSIMSDIGEQTATVEVNVRALRPADGLLEPTPGLELAYYEIDETVQALPDFDSMEPYLVETSTDLSYPSSSGQFINSGRAELVATLFSGHFWAESDGEYTFWSESNDGSRVFIGDEMVVDNDGIHGMLKRGGSIPLRQGWHEMRIEFFEYAENAGLFVTVSNPGSPAEPLRGALIAHSASEPCIADLNDDGELTFFDVSAFLVAYTEGDTDVADLTGDGLLNFFDVSAFLVSYESGCP